MKKKVRLVLLQPCYIPWIGYFDQIHRCNIFVFLDDVLYTKNDWRNRNLIKTPSGKQWLTIPVHIKNRISHSLLIKDAQIVDPKFYRSHLQSMYLNYKKAPYFHLYFQKLVRIYEHDYTSLSLLDIALIMELCKMLGICHVTFGRSSELQVESNNATERIIRICEKFKATHYLTGDSAKDYLQEDLFRQHGICLEYQQYKHPKYNQLWSEFIPHMSIVDLLFNEGTRSLEILANSS